MVGSSGYARVSRTLKGIVQVQFDDLEFRLKILLHLLNCFIVPVRLTDRGARRKMVPSEGAAGKMVM